MTDDVDRERLNGYLPELSAAAWRVRLHARIHGKTMVGCAVVDDEGAIHVGCNVEHRYRSHDIHAEVSALSAMVANSGGSAVAVFIAAEREQFTPCGACLDWIFELGNPDTVVWTQREESGAVATYTAARLMPHYPS